MAPRQEVTPPTKRQSPTATSLPARLAVRKLKSVVVDRLVERPGRAKAKLAVETHGSDVFGSDFQADPANANVMQAQERGENHRRADPTPSVIRCDADVLDVGPVFVGADGLDGAAVFGVPLAHADVLRQPSPLGQKAIAGFDLGHQLQTTFELAQAGKNLRIDFAAEAVIFHLGMRLQQRRVPGQQAIVDRQLDFRAPPAAQIKLHAITLNVLEVHETHDLTLTRSAVSQRATENIDRLPAESGLVRIPQLLILARKWPEIADCTRYFP